MRKFSAIFTTAPAFCLAFSFTLGVVAQLHHAGSWCLLGAMILGGVALLRRRHGGFHLMSLAICALLGAGRMHSAERPAPHSYRKRLLNELCSAELTLAIRDAPLLEGTLAAFDDERGLLTADIIAMRLATEDDFHPVTGRVSLTAGQFEDREPLRRLHPGECISAQGILSPAAYTDSLSATYSDFLRSRGIFHQFEIFSFRREPSRPPNAIQRARLALRRLRVAIAERLVRNFHSAESARLVLALGLGMSEFVPQDIRRRQLVSGTIHVFAISGMHIGMVTLMLALLLRGSGLPLRCQWSALGILSACYVLLTGSSVSSIRALLMVWCALYASFRHRRVAWLNALGCAEGIALLANPWQILDLGFLYTHLTVMVLLLGAPLVQEHLRLLAERKAWLPRELRPRHQTRLTQWLVGGLDASLLAWLGNLGISLHLNPQLSWGAPFLNLPLGMLIALVLALCPIRLLLSVLAPRADAIWARLLEASMQLTEAVAESGHRSAFEFTHPIMPIWAAALYYAGFFTILLCFYKLFNTNKL